MNRKNLVFLILFFHIISAWSQVTLRVINISENTPKDAQIYIAGSFNQWIPNKTVLTKDADGVYSVTIPESEGIVEYKFTLGTWKNAEADAQGFPLPNRSFSFKGKPVTLNLVIENWEQTTPAQSTAAENVSILEEDFYIPQLNRYRRIWIYLPPDYDKTDKRYPVMYMHDGQNLFDRHTSFSGEWEVDETLNRLFEDGDKGIIVVGVDNGGDKRIDELTPWANSKYGGGEGLAYIEFIAETLKPYIDTHYRTLTIKEYTGLTGSSLGGLISTYGAVQYNDVFGKIGSLSPAYWIVLDDFEKYISTVLSDLSETSIYISGGINESKNMVKDILKIKNALNTKGLQSNHTFIKLDSYGTHTESYWKDEFKNLYLYLFRNSERP